jgi:predicted outer membrane repeat protein
LPTTGEITMAPLPHPRFFALFLLLLPALSPAAVLRVGTGCSYATPQLAFAAAAHGDIVRIRSGNYLGVDNLSGPFIINHGIRVEGGYDDCSTSARSGRSDLHGNGSTQSATSLVTVNPLLASQKVVFDRITLRDNYKTSGNGAGLYVVGARVELNDVEFRDNRALDGYGGGVFLSNATLALEIDGTARIISNRASGGGGGIAADGSAARILFDFGAEGAAAAFTDNSATAPNSRGSAVYLTSGADAAFVDTAFTLTNAAPYFEPRSAVEADGFGAVSALSLVNCEVVDASVGNAYMGIFAIGGGTVSLRDTLVQGWRTGMGVNGGTATIEGGRFEANHAASGYGGAIRMLNDADLDVRGTAFVNNSATYGGAVALLGTSTWSIAGTATAPTRFENNGATDGGALYVESTGLGSINADPVFHGDVEFVGNSASGRGGAIHFTTTANDNLALYSPLMFDANHADAGGGAIFGIGNSYAIDARVDETILFENNSTSADGGAILRQDQGSVRLNFGAGSHGAIRFLNNQAGQGRGGSIASLGNGSLRLQAPMTFRHDDNASTADHGGQIAVVANTPQAGELLMQGWDGQGRGIVVAGGYAEYQGGGIYLAGGGVDATNDRVQVGLPGEPNRFFLGPGANIAVMNFANLVLRNSAISDADNTPVSPGKGSAIFADLGSTVLMESVFGSAGTPPAPGQAWPCEAATLAHDRHCSEIHDNISSPSTGGAVYADTGSQVTLRGVSIERNPGNPGAVFVATGAVVTASDVRILGHANAINVEGGGEFTGNHLTLADNTGAALTVLDGEGTNATLLRSIVWNNLAGIVLNGSATLDSGCNISQAGIHGTNANPMFVVGNRGSHRLGVGSPALDQCADPPGLFDLDGAPRQQGAGSDIGAYEGSAQQESLFGNGFE